MSQQKAVYYGQVELIPGVICDGYVLDDQTAMMSKVAVASLLSMRHGAFQNIATKGLPQALKPFWNNGLNIATKKVLVTAQNSNYKGRYVEVCDSGTIEALIRAYAFAFASDKLREKQEPGQSIDVHRQRIFFSGILAKYR